MKKLTKLYNTARRLTLALVILAGVGAALWKLTENERLKKQYMDTWQADAAKVRKTVETAVADAEKQATVADAAAPTATKAENEAERCAECDWEQDSGVV